MYQRVLSVSKLISLEKKVCLRKFTRFRGQSLVSPFLLSVSLSASLLPTGEHFSLLVMVTGTLYCQQEQIVLEDPRD